MYLVIKPIQIGSNTSSTECNISLALVILHHVQSETKQFISMMNCMKYDFAKQTDTYVFSNLRNHFIIFQVLFKNCLSINQCNIIHYSAEWPSVIITGIVTVRMWKLNKYCLYVHVCVLCIHTYEYMLHITIQRYEVVAYCVCLIYWR